MRRQGICAWALRIPQSAGRSCSLAVLGKEQGSVRQDDLQVSVTTDLTNVCRAVLLTRIQGGGCRSPSFLQRTATRTYWRSVPQLLLLLQDACLV